MKLKILKLSFIALILFYIGAGCEEDEIPEIPEDTITAKDYLGSYTGSLSRERLASNGFITDTNSIVERIPTEIEITHSDMGEDFLMVYVSAYNDSILCEFDESLGYVWIRDTAYSFYMRTYDFPDFDGIYYHAVSTYGNQGYWEVEKVVTLGFDFLKDLNDSIYVCETLTKKIN